jgi:subtilisin-like proprotein convertase family protein
MPLFGTWQIQITDEIAGETGTFYGWAMEVQGPGAVGSPAKPLPRDSTGLPLFTSSSSSSTGSGKTGSKTSTGSTTGTKVSAATRTNVLSSMAAIILSMISMIIVRFF